MVYYILPQEDKGEQMKKDIIGKEFCYLTVLEDNGKMIICKCRCGNIKPYYKSNVTNRKHTKSCGCYNSKVASTRLSNFNRSNSVTNGTCIINDLWKSFTKRASERGLKVYVTPQDLETIFNNQNGKCAFTGVDITLPKDSLERRKCKHTASLDRIDNSKPYTKDNIQWVHKVINIMRRSLTVDEFKSWCKKVADY